MPTSLRSATGRSHVGGTSPTAPRPSKPPGCGSRRGMRPAPGDNPAPLDAAARMDLIRTLCSFESRAAGTDAERRAASWLAARLSAGGRRVEVEPTYVHPRSGLVHAGHCLLGLAGSLLATVQPAIGFAIVLATAV